MMILQVNIGDDNNQNQLSLDQSDLVIFSNGYLNIDSGYTGVKKVIQEFDEIDTLYARYCHIIHNGNIYQVNYSGEKLYNSTSIVLSDASASMCKFSFRIIFIDYIVDQIKVPRIYSQIPEFFYANSSIDTVITPFMYTDKSGIDVGDILEIDEYRFIVTDIDTLTSYYKVQLKVYDETIVTISKDKYIVRDLDLPSTDNSFYNMIKVLFHDDEITLNQIPSVFESSDISDTDLRNFGSTYSWVNIDVSNFPFYLNIDSTIDLSNEMIITDFTLTSNINIGDSVIYGVTTRITDINEGDYLLFKNSVNSEIMIVTGVNLSYNSYTVSRPYTKYAFLSSDNTVMAYQSKNIYFQPIILNLGNGDVNYPIFANFVVKYLNI